MFALKFNVEGGELIYHKVPGFVNVGGLSTCL